MKILEDLPDILERQFLYTKGMVSSLCTFQEFPANELKKFISSHFLLNALDDFYIHR